MNPQVVLYAIMRQATHNELRLCVGYLKWQWTGIMHAVCAQAKTCQHTNQDISPLTRLGSHEGHPKAHPQILLQDYMAILLISNARLTSQVRRPQKFLLTRAA